MLDEKIREYILPVKILAEKNCENVEYLLQYHSDQSFFGGDLGCVLMPHGWFLVDFNKEYSGGVKIVANECSGNKNAKLRVVFGESAMEALSEIGDKGATNDHAIRDEILTVPWVGSVEYGNTGFRFLKIQNESDYPVTLRQVFAAFIHSNVEFVGKFRCNDEKINKIWNTAAYTVYLNIQDYVYDGIKRDRVVWIGDMHPETLSILYLAGQDARIERSLELVRNNTPADEWMNAIPSYSFWWLKIIRDYWLYTGKYDFLSRQKEYICALTRHILTCVEGDIFQKIGNLFIDWPSSQNRDAQKVGVYALLYLAICSAEELLSVFGDNEELIYLCKKAKTKLQTSTVPYTTDKQATSLLCFSGLADPKEINESILSREPVSGVSAFLGGYVLQARGMAHDIAGANDLLRQYWGAMIDLGATTFWEDFDIKWVKNAKPIDCVLSQGEYDVHGDNGGYCYQGYRHSLCHGWSSGPVSYLQSRVLGIVPTSPGFRTVRINPDLGDLDWVESECPTPYGNIVLECEKTDGKTCIKKLILPKEIKRET